MLISTVSRCGWALLAAAFLAGCASTSRQGSPIDLVSDASHFGARPAIVGAEAVYALSAEQRQAVLDYYDSPARQRTPPHERVHDYLIQVTRGFDFHNDTRTASEVLNSGSGNCLSLAILTTAVASLVGVEVGYQLVDATPVFEQRGAVVSRGVHVRSILYDPRWQVTDGASGARRPGIRFDYFPDDTQRIRLVGNLSESAYVAMYYSNVAGEALVSGDPNAAYWLLREALDHDPGNAIALNTLAVVYRHAGNVEAAERIYRYALEALPDKASFLRNYIVLLSAEGRSSEADRVRGMLDRLRDENPFSWVEAGRSALTAGEYREAARYFRRALELAPYLHEAHARLAIAYLGMGMNTRAQDALSQAVAHAPRRSTRSLYEAKLALLGSLTGP